MGESAAPGRWWFEVDAIDASVRTDYGTGVEHGCEWQWTIWEGDGTDDDPVLYGQTDKGDPTDVLAAIVARHNTVFEPFGLIWRPVAGSRRWQHRMDEAGRAYPASAEFVAVYRLTQGDQQ